MRRIRSLATIAAAATAVTIIGGAPYAGADDQREHTATIHDVHLAQGETLTIGLHPAQGNVELQVDAGAAAEVCPSSFEGVVVEPPDGVVPNPVRSAGWGAGFSSCIPLGSDGRAKLPASEGGLAHVALTVRAVEARELDVHRVRIMYVPSDLFFLVTPPSLAAGARSPRVTVVPRQSRTIGAEAYIQDFGIDPAVRVTVRQSHRRVPPSNAPIGADAPGYGPVRRGVAVSTHATNTGAVPVRVQLAIAWE
jgi:hypothetical protein